MKKFVFIALSLSLFSTAVFAKNITLKETFNNKIETINISLYSEQLKVIQNSGSDFSIEIDCNHKKYQPKVSYNNGEIRIKATRHVNIASIYICKIELSIPQNYKFDAINIESASGKISIEQLSAEEINISSISGAIEANSLSADFEANVHSTSGSLELKEIKGDEVNIATTSGSIDIDKVEAIETSFASVSGSIGLNCLDGESLDVHSVSGSQKLYDIFCDYFNLHAVSGSIALELADAPTASSEISTSSGSVRLYLQNNKGFDLSFETGSGSFKDKLTSNNFSPRKNFKASYFGGGPEISIKTGSGSLELSK